MEIVNAEPHILAAARDCVRPLGSVELSGTGVQHGPNVLMILKNSKLLSCSTGQTRANREHGKNSG
jgi:hypothetical protein